MDPTTWQSCLGDPFRAPASNRNDQTNSVNPGENEGAPQASSSSTSNESYPEPDLTNLSDIAHCLSVLREANYYRLNPFRGWSIPRLHDEVLRETIHLNDVLQARHFQHYIHELSVHEDPEIGRFAHGLLSQHIESTVARCVEVEAQMVRPARLEQLVDLVGFLRKVVRAKYADTDSSSEYEFVRDRFRPATCPECGYYHRPHRIRRTRDRGARGRRTRGRGARGRGARGRGTRGRGRGRGSRGRGGQGSRAVDLRNPYYHRRFIEKLADQAYYWDWPWFFHPSSRRWRPDF